MGLAKDLSESRSLANSWLVFEKMLGDIDQYTLAALQVGFFHGAMATVTLFDQVGKMETEEERREVLEAAIPEALAISKATIITLLQIKGAAKGS